MTISTSVSTMTFCAALGAVLDGKGITRLEWNNQNVVGMLRDGKLMLFRGGKWHHWIVNDGDMLGTDWVVSIV